MVCLQLFSNDPFVCLPQESDRIPATLFEFMPFKHMVRHANGGNITGQNQAVYGRNIFLQLGWKHRLNKPGLYGLVFQVWIQDNKISALPRVDEHIMRDCIYYQLVKFMTAQVI